MQDRLVRPLLAGSSQGWHTIAVGSASAAFQNCSNADQVHMLGNFLEIQVILASTLCFVTNRCADLLRQKQAKLA